jgi:hypothetical protein
MRAVTTSTVERFDSVARHRPARVRRARVFGLVIASLAPALIWTLLIEAIASWLNVSLAPQTTIATATAIALFLAAVCAPLVLRDAS